MLDMLRGGRKTADPRLLALAGLLVSLPLVLGLAAPTIAQSAPGDGLSDAAAAEAGAVHCKARVPKFYKANGPTGTVLATYSIRCDQVTYGIRMTPNLVSEGRESYKSVNCVEDGTYLCKTTVGLSNPRGAQTFAAMWDTSSNATHVWLVSGQIQCSLDEMRCPIKQKTF